MTLAELLCSVNAAGIGLANVGGQLQLRGPPGAITPEIRAGAGEHKEALLELLPIQEQPLVEGPNAEKPAASLQEVSSWDEAEARCLLLPAIQLLEQHEYSSDTSARAMQFAAADAIDSCWLSQDRTGLKSAVDRFLRLMQPEEKSLLDDGMFDPRFRLPPGCPGCDFCRPTGLEPSPRPGEDLASVLQRIRSRSLVAPENA
jgi:hypothetical protein